MGLALRSIAASRRLVIAGLALWLVTVEYLEDDQGFCVEFLRIESLECMGSVAV